MKLNRLKKSARLQTIEQLVTSNYTHIWDCCCDHGLLGINLLNGQVASTVHFVDIVPRILSELQGKLEKYWQGDIDAWMIHCTDVKALAFDNYGKSETHLIIIAGVGGELMMEIISSLLAKIANIDAEFILCPVHHNYEVRRFLIGHGMGLIDEHLVFENKRFYEIMHVSRKARSKISCIGDKMWELQNPLHRQYLQKKIKHYQTLVSNSKYDADDVNKSYQALLDKVMDINERQ
ncbi:tRNA (adenine(22)-N(1))-methyltransferase TrmK [Psychromonas sp. MME2]|uniref:tRNA (adenine(22)-N(1))-methyltransferase n=1 Tax=unclassified Psychromonas TaxID=2614957 RepID=UPI00339C1C2D